MQSANLQRPLVGGHASSIRADAEGQEPVAEPSANMLRPAAATAAVQPFASCDPVGWSNCISARLICITYQPLRRN